MAIRNLRCRARLATLIVKNGKGVLYDTGPSWNGGSMARLEILPYLQREGIELDWLIISHDDNDHAGGAKDILAAYPTVKFISPSNKIYGEKTIAKSTALCAKPVKNGIGKD